VPGLAVAVRRANDSRACVICVHGALDRGSSFARLARRLVRFDVVTYDRRGYQGSRVLQPVDFDHHVDDLSALVEREAPRQPVILFGHSFGGVIAFAAALRDPRLMSFVVNYEAPLPSVLSRPRFRRSLTDDPRAEAERFFRRVMFNGAWERLSEPQRESRRLDGPALLVDLATVRRSSAPFDLASLRVPATYAYGDGDAASLEYYRALSAMLVQVSPAINTVEIPKAVHSAHLKNAEELADLITQRFAATCASA